MAGKLADLFVNIGAKIDDFVNGTNKVKSETAKLGYSLSNLRDFVVGAFAVEKVIEFASEISKLAQVSEGVEVAFKRIGDERQLEGLRKATKGTVSDLELMKAAVQSSQFKIPLDQLGSLLAFAHQRAKDTGQSVDYLVQSIVLGIGRKSPMILDSLGISAVALKEKLKGVGSETASVGDMARAVGAIASEEMAKIGESVDLASEKFAKQQAVIENWKVSLGKGLNAILSIFTSLISSLDDMISRMAVIMASQNISGMDKFLSMLNSKNFEKVSDTLTGLQKTATINAELWVDKLKESLKEFNGDSIKAMEFLKKKQMDLVNQLGEFEGKKISELPKAYQVAYSEIQQEYNAISKIINSPLGIDHMLFPNGPEEVISDLKKVDKEVEDIWKDMQREYDAEMITDPERWGSPGDPIKAIEPGKLIGPDISGATKLAEDVKDGIIGIKNEVVAATIEMNSAITDFVDSFASSVGELLSGASSFDDFGQAILKSVGGFMSALGKQLIALGIAKIVADSSLSIPGGGVTLLAAGAMLVALGSAVNATMSSSPMSSGSHGSGSSYYSSSLQKQAQTIEIEGELKGTDIYWSLKRTVNKLANTSS